MAKRKIPAGKVECEDCSGDGSQSCGDCGGSGLTTDTCNLDYEHEHDCGSCEGSGCVDCSECDSSGYVDDPDYEVDVDL